MWPNRAKGLFLPSGARRWEILRTRLERVKCKRVNLPYKTHIQPIFSFILSWFVFTCYATDEHDASLGLFHQGWKCLGHVHHSPQVNICRFFEISKWHPLCGSKTEHSSIVDQSPQAWSRTKFIVILFTQREKIALPISLIIYSFFPLFMITRRKCSARCILLVYGV